jgi:hypothetical protein
MLHRIDQSPLFARALEGSSNFIARYRGLPVILGIILVLLSMILQIGDVYTQSKVITVAGIITHHVGVLIALIGLLLIVPIGK